MPLELFAGFTIFNVKAVKGVQQLMADSRLKFLTVVLMLLVYAGQSWAVLDVACAKVQDSSLHSVHDGMPEGMQHADHQQAANPDACDCCDMDRCSIGHCSSVLAAAIDQQPAPAAFVAELYRALRPPPYPAADQAALFRPPIFR